MAFRAALALSVGFWPSLLLAAAPVLKGTEIDLWQTHSVVYAEVAASSRAEESIHNVTLDVKARLAGSLDPSVNHRIVARLYQDAGTRVPAPPPVKSRVVVLLRCTAEGVFIIPWCSPLFTPTRSPIVIVSSFEDRRLNKTIAALRLIRTFKNDSPSNIAKLLEDPLGSDFWEERQ